jgi:hypothetical protein
MSDANKPFAFSQFVPGFDFLRSLASGSATAGAVPGLPSLASWVAPTLSVEEVDKRIQELKTVQFWLEQNGHALKATIQALEVQKMTLSTLRGMNVQMEDLASVFTRQATVAASAPAFRAESPAAAPEPKPEPRPEPQETAKPEPEPAPAPEEAPAARSKRARSAEAADAAQSGVVDPLQWWGALTQQFQQIAASALQEASQLKVPAVAQPLSDAVGRAMTPAKGKAPAKRTASRKAPAAGRKTAAAGKSSAPPRERARGH